MGVEKAQPATRSPSRRSGASVWMGVLGGEWERARTNVVEELVELWSVWEILSS
jgi:hypothetical protein